MSYEWYAKWWVVAKDHYESLMQYDRKTVKETKVIKARTLAIDLIGGLHTRYAVAVNELGIIYDHMAHPQKRETVKKIFESAATRLNELNTELRNIDISEFHYVDGTLIELKLVPRDIQLLDNFYPPTRERFIEQLWSKIKAGETIYTPPPPPPKEEKTVEEGEPTLSKETSHATLGKSKSSKTLLKTRSKTVSFIGSDPEGPKKPKNPYERILTPEEIEENKRKQLRTNMIQLIQTAERARQDRLYFADVDRLKKLRKRMQRGKKSEPPDLKVLNKASITIQKYWRGHKTRRYLKRREDERRLLIRMTEPSWRSKESFEVLKRNLEKRRQHRDQRIKEYIEANLAEKVRVFKMIAPGLMEDIGDEIREWFRIWYNEAKVFDNIPEEEKGGTVLVIRGETLTPEEYVIQQEEKKKAKKKAGGMDKAKLKAEKEKAKKAAKEAKKKERERKKKEAAMKRKRLRNFDDYEYEFEPTGITKLYDDAMEEHRNIWDPMEDDPEERHVMEMITDEKCYEMQLEVRKQVDELMRLELELLQMALAKDKKKKYKAKKGKKKGKRGKKKKGGKDLTAERSTEDLFQELVDMGIIHNFNKVALDDFIGDHSYSNWNYRNIDSDPPPALGDVRQAVKINCVLPLTVDNMKRHKSVLLVGYPKSGKKLLANAVINETQSIVFDLSPEILVGKYEKAKGMKMLFHLVNKMSRILQPSIIYLPEVERAFYKKVPKEEKELNPKRISGKLKKEILKKIKPEDRVLILGTTSRPQLAQAKMTKIFERIILIPKTDYGSAMMYWRQLLMAFHGVDRNFEVTPLAKLSVNYPFMCIKEAVEKVMVTNRIIQLKYKPLHQKELLEYMINHCEEYVAKNWKKIEGVALKCPLGKLRKAYNKWSKRQKDQESATADKKKR